MYDVQDMKEGIQHRHKYSLFYTCALCWTWRRGSAQRGLYNIYIYTGIYRENIVSMQMPQYFFKGLYCASHLHKIFTYTFYIYIYIFEYISRCIAFLGSGIKTGQSHADLARREN